MFEDYRVAYLRKHVKVRDVQRLSFLRQSVAYFLSESARKTPHAAMVIDYDVTNVIAYADAAEERVKADTSLDSETRRTLRAQYRNYSAFFLKATAHSLHHTPCMNGFLDYAPLRYGGTFYRAEDVNLSVTVHTKSGVIKPVVRNAHLKEFGQVAEEMRALTRKTRRTDAEALYRKMARVYVRTALRELDLRGLPAMWIWLREEIANWFRPKEGESVPESEQLQPEDVMGATCTLANIGMVVPGNQTLTVIIPPEVMMFGIGNLHQAPRVVDGQIVARWVITMTGTMDHRAFDAGEAFPFAHHMQRYVEKPELIFDWKPGDSI
jgi:pyruvate/2-oxoglutarate dehydrogenase complex dihydrolipoamide acyltransferase (E2) component